MKSLYWTFQSWKTLFACGALLSAPAMILGFYLDVGVYINLEKFNAMNPKEQEMWLYNLNGALAFTLALGHSYITTLFLIPKVRFIEKINADLWT